MNKKKRTIRTPSSALPAGCSYASFDRRLIAATIDIFILILVSLPLTRLLEYLFFGGSNSSEVITEIMENHQGTIETSEFVRILKENGVFYKMMALQLGSIILLWAYCIFSWTYMKATIGKYIMKLQVLNENGKNLSLLQSNARFLGYIPSVLFIFLGFFWIYFNDKCKAWHDYLAKTVVIYCPKVK